MMKPGRTGVGATTVLKLVKASFIWVIAVWNVSLVGNP